MKTIFINITNADGELLDRLEMQIPTNHKVVFVESSKDAYYAKTHQETLTIGE